MSEDGSLHEVIGAVVFYMLCSSVMLVANKVAVTWVPLPGLVVSCQFICAVAFIYARSAVADNFELDTFTYERVIKFLPYVAAMSLCIFSNVQSLYHSNVETVIVFRACSPIFVSILDWFFLGRELPSPRSASSLLIVFFGAVGYVATDSEFSMNGMAAYTWVSVYFFAIVAEMTYGKIVMSRMEFKNPVWGSTLYTNLLCLPPMLAMAIWSSEPQRVQEVEMSTSGALAVLFTCVVGICISYAGWNCRGKTSATTFTLLGVACKLISVLINILIWDKHASGPGIVCLLVCIGASSAYRQSPMRPMAPPKSAVRIDTEFGLDDPVELGSAAGES